MSRIRFLPFVLMLLLTGCTMRAEIDHEQGTKTAAAETAFDQTCGGARRQSQLEESRTAFRLVAETRPFGDSSLPHTGEGIPAKPKIPPTPILVVEGDAFRDSVSIGTVNVHIRDVHHHHVRIEQTINLTGQTVAVTTEATAADPTPQADSVAEDERCERPRKEHEARLVQWDKLFDGPRRGASEGRRR